MAQSRLVWMLSAAAVGGCAGLPEAAPEPVTVVVPADADAAAAADRVYGAVDRTLRDYLFAIDREDRSFGRVVSRPLQAPAVFEFWRRDAVGLANFWEGTKHRIRRTATAEVRRRPDGAFTVEWVVVVERFADPTQGEFDVGSLSRSAWQDSAGGGGLLGSHSRRLADPTGGWWVDLGRDHRLEQALADHLRRTTAVPR
jgi:hypothetical protein